MKTLYIERSASGGRDGAWTGKLDLDGIGRIVVGTGPGSFAGIRSAIAFAQGYALGSGCEVLGMPSPCALAAQTLARGGSTRLVAVVGDARRGMCWIAPFDGFRMIRDVFQVGRESLGGAVADAFGHGSDFVVTTPDAARMDAFLREMFAGRYMGGQTPTPEGLRAFAEANPGILSPEPLPIYLNPAVRV